MQNEENKYIANIKVIKDLADADFDIIKGIVETTSNTQDLTKLECEAFDSYLVINLDVTDKKSNDYLSLKDKSGVYVFKMIEDWTVPSDFNSHRYCAKMKDKDIKKFEKDKILYAGKSYEMIKRINEHYSKKLSKPYSLKLGYDGRKGLKEKSIMMLFLLKDELKEHKDVILPLLEGKLHAELQPLVGSRRI